MILLTIKTCTYPTLFVRAKIWEKISGRGTLCSMLAALHHYSCMHVLHELMIWLQTTLQLDTLEGNDLVNNAQRKRLFSEPQPVPSSAPEVWSDEENKALIEFVLFHCDPAVWPSHKKASKFWSDAANFVQQRSKASAKRTGS